MEELKKEINKLLDNLHEVMKNPTGIDPERYRMKCTERFCYQKVLDIIKTIEEK